MERVLSCRAATLARRLGVQAQPLPQTGVVLSRRHSHTRRRAEEVLEADAAGPSTTPSDAAVGPSTTPADPAAVARRLEEAIDGAMARMAEPDWAPFRPGTSYFVPPRPAGAALGILALLGHGGGFVGSPAPRRGLSADEARAVAAASRGYPCSTYFIDGHFPDEGESSSLDANQAQDE
ncbi:hypothetical protein SETIT_4G188500v2 [Setaria italica]|uniref:Uncharacterized protein n=1 Tax=Setaria italica TaxID=4555 RepID=K3XZK0_SETIT|nr:uncharacterized protein LOC101783764 [Setaria italica]RCV22043.1 hypothetical protein SETIT_4G188500v2 [Setaria italica]